MQRFIVLSLCGLALACAKPGEPAKAPAAAAPAPASADGYRLPKDQVIARWNGGQMTYGELREKKAASFRKITANFQRELFKAETQETEGMVIEMLLDAEAKKQGKANGEEYLKHLAENPPVPEAEMMAFYEQNVKAQPGAPPYDQIKSRIGQFLGMQRAQKEVERLKTEVGLKVELPPPESAKATFDLADRPMKGNPNAKVTIVEFSDFQCPYCSRAVPQIEAILKAYPNDVKIYFMHFPLSFHQEAMPAAVASRCAQQQGKFWEMHDKIFQNAQNLTRDAFTGYAKEFALDEAKFTACLDDASVKEYVKKDMEQGEAAGVEGTPSFYINGVKFEGGVPTPEALKSYVGT